MACILRKSGGDGRKRPNGGRALEQSGHPALPDTAAGAAKTPWNWRQVGLLLLAVIAAQAVYWLILDQHLFHSPRAETPPMVEQTATAIARLPDVTPAAVANAQYKATPLPHTHCCDAAAFAVRIQFQVDTVPDSGLGVISLLQVDNYRMAVNGSTLVAPGRLAMRGGSYHGQRTHLTRIPAGLLKVGTNELTYVTVRNGFPYTDLYPPLIGEYNAMQAFSGARLWLVYDYHIVIGVLLALLGLIAAIMVVRSDDWRFAMWLSLLCAACVGHAVYTLWLDIPVDGFGRMALFFAVNMAIPTALLCFVDSWTGRPMRWLQPAAMAGYAAAMAVILYYLYEVAMPDGFDTPTVLWVWFLCAYAVAVVARLMWHFAAQRETRIVESALLTVLAATIAKDAIAAQWPEWMLGEGNLLAASPFLLVAMMLAFVARNFRLFQSQNALSSLLQAKVEQREAELAVAHAREQDLVRQQAHDAERRRIMQDIHDGLGSQLMSMMLSARLGKAEPAQVAEGLQGVIDEMRLMVDSMDSVGESLPSALATFRARVAPRVAEAGFAMDWQQPDTFAAPDYGPRDVLQIFRILQEAVTNALKHSGGDAIRVAVEPRGDGALSIAISDNGAGGAAKGDAGRGMVNMYSRAKAAGADLSITSDAGRGTHIALHLPARLPHLAVA